MSLRGAVRSKACRFSILFLLGNTESVSNNTRIYRMMPFYFYVNDKCSDMDGFKSILKDGHVFCL